MKREDIKTIIGIGAHCGDVEGRAGGLFARLTRKITPAFRGCKETETGFAEGPAMASVPLRMFAVILMDR